MSTTPQRADPRCSNWDLILPGDPHALSDKQWAEIVRYSALPSEVRPLIGRAIALFREVEKAGRFTPAKTRKQLHELRNKTLALHELITEAMANPHAHFALTVPITKPGTFAEPRHQAQSRLESHLENLQRLVRWFEVAADRVDGIKPGANRKAGNVRWLVAMLDAILQEHAGRKISRSIKRANTTREYITVIVKIADPRIRHGTIERAMQEQIKLREAVARHRHLAAAR